MQNKKKQVKNQVTNEVSKEFRDTVANMFVEFINSKATQDEWHSGLGTCIDTPVNAISNIKYRGINRLYLMMLMQKNNWTDNRFLTFRQAEKEHYVVKKGSKSALVEYWFPYDFSKDKPLSWEEYNKILQADNNDKEKTKVGLTAKYFHVFNASQIAVIPEKSQSVGNIEPTLIISRLTKEMGINIYHDSESNAFYKADTDDIHLPPLNSFVSAYDYALKVLHELIFAAGSVKRLNIFQNGTYDLAQEELIVEIATIFMSQRLGQIGVCRNYENNHVQSWINLIQSDTKHKALFNAIKEAEKVTDYLEKFL